MGALGSVAESVFVRTVICCALVCCSAALAAQTIVPTMEPASSWPAQIRLLEAAKPLVLGERIADLGLFANADVDGAAAPGGDDAARRNQIIIWGVVLGGTHAATILTDAAVGNGIDFPEVFIPVMGPWIALARFDSVVINPVSQEATRRDKFLFAASGVVQGVSLALLLRASLSGRGDKKSSGLNHLANISLTPTDRHGFLLSYRRRF